MLETAIEEVAVDKGVTPETLTVWLAALPVNMFKIWRPTIAHNW